MCFKTDLKENINSVIDTNTNDIKNSDIGLVPSGTQNAGRNIKSTGK